MHPRCRPRAVPQVPPRSGRSALTGPGPRARRCCQPRSVRSPQQEPCRHFPVRPAPRRHRAPVSRRSHVPGHLLRPPERDGVSLRPGCVMLARGKILSREFQGPRSGRSSGCAGRARQGNDRQAVNAGDRRMDTFSDRPSDCDGRSRPRSSVLAPARLLAGFRPPAANNAHQTSPGILQITGNRR